MITGNLWYTGPLS